MEKNCHTRRNFYNISYYNKKINAFKIIINYYCLLLLLLLFIALIITIIVIKFIEYEYI